VSRRRGMLDASFCYDLSRRSEVRSRPAHRRRDRRGSCNRSTGAAVRDSVFSYWSVYIDLTAEAAEAFQVATKAAVGSVDPQNQIAIIVEGRIVSSPTVAAPITSGNVVLTGSFTKTQARSLASNLSGSG
jgi:preprotein translocase subunit SecD